MSYTIIRTNGTTLTTIQDGTINTTSTSLGLPGKNYSNYGIVVDTNLVKITECFAANTPPPNPITGQLWYNTNAKTLNVCPVDGTTDPTLWVTLAVTNAATNTFGNVIATGNISANNASIAYKITSNSLAVTTANITTINATSAVVASGTINSLNTQIISAGSAITNGMITGIWSFYGDTRTNGNAIEVQAGNIVFSSSSIGIKTDNYMYANGAPFTPTGTFTQSNVANYLTGTGIYSGGGFTGPLTPSIITTSLITGGGNLTGIWNVPTGAGNLLTGNIIANIANYVTGSNVDGQVANALIAGTVYSNYQPNITTIGTLSTLHVTGSLTAGNANLGYQANALYFVGDGSQLTNINGSAVGNVANANYAAYAGTVTLAAQSNITTIGTLGNLSVTSNITAGNVAGGNLVSANYVSGNGSLLTSITGANVTGRVANALYANSAGSIIGNSVASSGSSGSLQTSNFSIIESGGKLLIQYNGRNIISINSLGDLVVANNITAFNGTT